MKLTHTPRHPVIKLALSTLIFVLACGRDGPVPVTSRDGAAADTPATTSTQYVVAVDLSSSLTATERANHEALLHALVNELDFGDRLVLLKAHADGVRDSSTTRVVSIPVPQRSRPSTRDLSARALARQTADLYVTSLFKSAPVNGTDLFATMHTAAENTGQGGGARRVLLILSDMLQCADSLCIEPPRDVPDSAWITGRKERRLIPSLDAVCVSVVGADKSTEHGVQVLDFWRRYFQAAGANFDPRRYVHSGASPAMLRC
jgi:hypothetical protein